MLSEEKMIEIMENIYKIDMRTNLTTTMNINDFKDKFDYETFCAISNILDNSKTFSLKEWQEVYNQNYHSDIIKQLLMIIPNTPIDIVEDIVQNTTIIRNNITDPDTQRYNEKILLLNALKHNISRPTLDAIFSHIKKSIVEIPFSLTDNMMSYNEKPLIDSIPEKNIEHIVNLIVNSKIEDLISHSEVSSEEYQCFDFLKHIKDKSFIEKLLRENPDLHEQAKTALINNEYLDPKNPADAELINKIFEASPDIRFIKNHTNETKEKTLEILYEGFMMTFNSSKILSFDNCANNATLLSYFALDGHLNSTPQELSLINNLLSKHNPVYHIPEVSNLVLTIFKKTKNPDVLSYLDLLPKYKRYPVLMRNKNLPVSIYKKDTFECLDKMICKGKMKSVTQENIDFITQMAKTITFRQDDYQKILEDKALSVLLPAIASSEQTPDWFLKKIIDSQDTNFKLKMLSRTNLLHRQSAILTPAKSDISDYIKNIPEASEILIKLDAKNKNKIISDFAKNIIDEHINSISKFISGINTKENEENSLFGMNNLQDKTLEEKIDILQGLQSLINLNSISEKEKYLFKQAFLSVQKSIERDYKESELLKGNFENISAEDLKHFLIAKRIHYMFRSLDGYMEFYKHHRLFEQISNCYDKIKDMSASEIIAEKNKEQER